MHIDFLLSGFEENINKYAVIYKSNIYTYSNLLNKVKSLQKDFIDDGIIKASAVAIEADNPFYSLSALLALIELNCIMIPVTPDSIIKKEEYIDIAEIEYLINFTGDKCQITRTEKKAANEYYDTLRELEHPGLVLFSSGTSGKSKAAVHDFTKLLMKYKTQRKDLVTLAFMLFDHIGGVDTIFYSLSNASTVVFPEDRSPDTICKNIEKHKIEVLPATPTFLNLLLLSDSYEKYDLSSLKYITYGTEPMPKHTLNKLNIIFPNVKFLQKYGTTEVGTLRSKSESKDSDWVKIGGEGYQTRVVDGMLQIKADSAMLGYLNAPSPFTEDGWFHTGDEVEVKGDYYRIFGRRSEMINVGGEKVYPAEVEAVIQELDFVAEAIVTHEENMIMGNIVVAKVSIVDSDHDKKSIKKIIKQHCKTKLQEYKVPVKIEIYNKELHSKRFKKIRNFE